jgi:hypothetical protein
MLLRPNLVRAGQQHNLMPDCHPITNGEHIFEIERASNIDQALPPDYQVLVEFAPAINVGAPADDCPFANLEACPIQQLGP